MVDIVNEAIEMMIAQAEKENGGEAIDFEEQDLAGVFNDAVVVIGLEDGTLKVKVVAGEPMRFDHNLNLLEEVGDDMQDNKCRKTECFANGCDGTCKLEHLYLYYPHLIAECDPRYTCKRAIEIKRVLLA